MALPFGIDGLLEFVKNMYDKYNVLLITLFSKIALSYGI
jgi:hypothetical protein